MSDQEWHWLARTAEETEHLGASLARAVPETTEAPAVVYLSGELGAGKTTLARGFLRASGFAGVVRSPTYTLLECYEVSGQRQVVHMDLFRLNEPRELEALGARDLARPAHIWLVEWPERGAGHLPAPDLVVELRVTPRGHEANFRVGSAAGRVWLHDTVELQREGT